MRLLGLKITRENAREDPVSGELGVDADPIVTRYTHALMDANPRLQGIEKFRQFDEMVHSDSTAKQVVWMPKLAIRGAHWEVEPASEDGVDRLIADAAAWNFGLNDQDGHMQQSWPQSLDQALLHLRYGCMFEEIVWGDITSWRDTEGVERQIRPVDRLAPRLPQTIWKIDYTAGQVRRVEQNLLNARPIPGEKLCYYALEPEPGRWDGVSLLRSAWGPWELKRQLMVAAGIAWDRWAAGFPVVRYPKSEGAAALEKAEELGRAIRNHERAYAAFAGAAPTEQNPDGWDITIQGGAGVLPDPTPLMIRYELAIYGAGLMQWMALGTSSHTGARATAEVQDEPFYLALEAISQDLALERRRQLFRRFVDVNFGTEYDVPRLTVSKIQSEDVEKLARILADLKTAGFNLSYRDLQNYVLALEHLPELPETLPAAPAEGDGLPAAPPQPALPPPGA